METNNTTITTVPTLGSSHSLECKDLYSALAKAQAEMQSAIKDSNNPFFKSKYADFAEVVRVSRPALTAHALCVSQRIILLPDGTEALHTVLGHASGQYIDSTVRIKPQKNDVQALGSYITYLKRYSYAALVGVCTEDDDGEGAMSRDYKHAPGSHMTHVDTEGDTITQAQLETLRNGLNMLENATEVTKSILDSCKISDLASVKATQYDRVLAYIKKRLAGA